MTLRHLAASLDNVRAAGSLDGEVVDIVHDSRAARPNAVFVALRGERRDGVDFIGDALARGSTCVVVDASAAHRILPLPASVTALFVPDPARALARLAATLHGAPSQHLRVVGITGTNGKTTTAALVATILNGAGIPCGRIGTLGAHFADAMWPLEHTTPFASELQALLAEMRKRGAQAAAIEVSSHALVLGRVADVRIEIGVLTNVTRDHLDFHETPEAYVAAKRSLFDLSQRAVLNADDVHGKRWAAELRAAGRPAVTYGIASEADVQATNVEIGAYASSFEVDGMHFALPLPGRFNVSNALAAIAVTRTLGLDDTATAAGLAAAAQVPGRMERVGDGEVTALVDYAHTPDALRVVLRAAREMTSRRVIVVFGCGGDRDRGKRPLMGRVASELADLSIVTSDNPRGENPNAIVDEIVRDLAPGAAFEIEIDRRRAIGRAIERAAPGDLVVVAGKGHEAYQIVGAQALRFDDAHEVRVALARRTAAGSPA